ncbi:cysteine desulfurase [Nitzschia inconspicua]|uniref:Cysteine desulfurase n=1 Tax=Nitzschia inconspicua TaxID=303405 RepID=A0A9K3L6B2_9STRA|nr:cysteine desulfurase [Nitzschia inconspicua]
MTPTAVEEKKCFTYEATGVVANARLGPLLPSDWIDISGKRQNDGNATTIPDFLWENCPRQETKQYRDDVKVYSHLPNGCAILDSKWVLGRLLSPNKINSSSSSLTCDNKITQNPLLATCETHCFTGIEGFRDFAGIMDLLPPSFQDAENKDSQKSITNTENENEEYEFCDLLDMQDSQHALPVATSSSTSMNGISANKIPLRPNLWVIKDAMANGAGGVWVVGQGNAHEFMDVDKTPLYPEHKYVAQQYVWPMITYGGKKCHVRVYTTITCDGRAFIHQRAFLHVANEPFTLAMDRGQPVFDNCIHITNCCANSHDESKFSGEILADFTATEMTTRDGHNVVPLAIFFPSVRATVQEISEKAFPFMDGGQKNHGFEYCGMDFILSYDDKGTALAYLLEINAPPSQDTATGLVHAENLHNDVLRDWMNYWVVPHVEGRKILTDTRSCGWICVYNPPQTFREDVVENDELILPSKAAILNKIRWALFEKKAQKTVVNGQFSGGDNINGAQEIGLHPDSESVTFDSASETNQISIFARSHFPYFSSQKAPIFFENAGGAQVPQSVIQSMVASLQCRNRTTIGTETKAVARETIKTLLGAKVHGSIVLADNATTLFARLVDCFVDQGLLTAADEIVISTENHQAHFNPWVTAAKRIGATIKLWSPREKNENCFAADEPITRGSLEELITPQTRIVAISHANNVLGFLRPIQQLAQSIKRRSNGRAMVVVDGVAAVPHIFAAFDSLGVDFYVVSFHKMFGPHVGALIVRRGQFLDHLTRLDQQYGLMDQDASLRSMMEKGTLNIEGCAGVAGVGEYLKSLGGVAVASSVGVAASNKICDPGEMPEETRTLPFCGALSEEDVSSAYVNIRRVEAMLVRLLIEGLTKMPRIQIIQPNHISEMEMIRLPIVSFVHKDISSARVVKWCSENGISCRHGLFLNTHHFAREFRLCQNDGLVRVSLAHYNTIEEVQAFCGILRRMPVSELQ